MAHYIGIDVGTGSARACVISEAGDIVGLASHDIQKWNDKHGYYEQSTTDIWAAIGKAVQQAIREIDPTSVCGIGFDATCSLAVFTQQGEPISVTPPNFKVDADARNVILWLDHRPEAETALINRTNHPLLKYVGGTMSIEMEIPKALWLKNNLPSETFANARFYDLADALTFLATGDNSRSFCSAVCKQGYVPVGVDGSVKGWQADFLTSIGLTELCENDFVRMGGVNGVNGRFLTAGEPVGKLSETAAAQLGLPAGIAVGSGVIDAYAGWIGTVGAKVDIDPKWRDESHEAGDVSQAFTRLAAVAGTSTCHLAMSPDPVFVPGVWGPYRDVLIPGYWMAEGGQSATGELLQHIIMQHPAAKELLMEAERAGQKVVYEYLNGKLKKMAADAGAPDCSVSWLGRHFFFYGDFFGNRSPVADSNMRGSVTGLSNDISVDNLALQYYGTMEFIALQTRQIVSTMNDAGHRIRSIFMSGGQCRNDILMALISTACDMPVFIPRYVDAAVVHGAAMLGAKAASHAGGQGESLWDIMARMSKPGSTVYPSSNLTERKLLDVKYKVFLEQCEQQQRWRREVDEALAGTKP
ncbi:Pentulose kinase [Trichodelitschia bisporula]|uniref:Pentulose kinase n=1 Tax=Trichodelitschia bisporula TaxID=703511 RepID=A0A6G1HJQ2_9PEZI|nr:Pentulose kinase [Trichodelitschia bisporula]